MDVAAMTTVDAMMDAAADVITTADADVTTTVVATITQDKQIPLVSHVNVATPTDTVFK